MTQASLIPRFIWKWPRNTVLCSAHNFLIELANSWRTGSLTTSAMTRWICNKMFHSSKMNSGEIHWGQSFYHFREDWQCYKYAKICCWGNGHILKTIVVTSYLLNLFNVQWIFWGENKSQLNGTKYVHGGRVGGETRERKIKSAEKTIPHSIPIRKAIGQHFKILHAPRVCSICSLPYVSQCTYTCTDTYASQGENRNIDILTYRGKTFRSN